MVVIYAFSFLFAPQDLRPLFYFMTVYGLRWLIVAVAVTIRYWRGKDVLHSQYNGRPYLCRFFPHCKEVSAKHLEALAAILLGWGVHHFNRPLGDYLMLAASLVFLRVYGLAAHQRRIVVEMNDRMVQQQLIADRFRELREL
jgi:hypothetical protein